MSPPKYILDKAARALDLAIRMGVQGEELQRTEANYHKQLRKLVYMDEYHIMLHDKSKRRIMNLLHIEKIRSSLKQMPSRAVTSPHGGQDFPNVCKH